MTPRRRLPARRHSEGFDFEVGGLRYHCTFLKFADGSVGDLILTSAKSGSMSDANACDAAVTCSIAPQYGVPIEVIRKALMRDARGNARTPLGAALDLIAER